MQLADLIDDEHVETDVPAASRKRALEYLGDLAVRGSGEGLTPQEAYASLLAREKLGSTAIGHGVAIPHGRLPHGSKTLAAFVRLREGVDFDAPDHEAVDLVFALLVPAESTEEHLQLLAQLAAMFSDPEFRRQLRQARDKATLLRLLRQRARAAA